MLSRTAYVTPDTLTDRTRAWLSGLGSAPGRLFEPGPVTAGLALIDCQRLFCDPASPAWLPAWEACEPVALRLVDAFIDHGLPVVLTRHIDPVSAAGSSLRQAGGRPIRPDDPLSRLVPRVREKIPPAVIHTKSRHAAFALRLPPALRTCRCLLLAGVQTHRCIAATAIDLNRRGIVPLVVADGCAATDEQSHLAGLRVLASGHAGVVTAVETHERLDRDLFL